MNVTTIYIILKFRGKSVVILTLGLLAGVVVIAVILAVPQLREIDAIAGSTITTKAVANAVNAAIVYSQSLVGGAQ